MKMKGSFTTNFKFSGEEYAKYDKINWFNIYKEMSKDLELYKLLKKNNYYQEKPPEINEVSSIISTVPLKDDLKPGYFSEYYQKNLNKYLDSKISINELMNTLNFPRITSKKQQNIPRESQLQVLLNAQANTKRLNIKDMRATLERLNYLSNESKKQMENSSLINMSSSTTDFLNKTVTFKNEISQSHSNTNNKNPPPATGRLNAEKLKYAIIKNLIFEKFQEREQRKKAKKAVSVHSAISQNNSKLPKILQNIENIENEILDKIENKNLSSINPRHHSFYLSHQRKLSDGTLKSERKPLKTDPKGKSYKKMVEDFKARNIMYSNLKYHINKSADGYIDCLSHFKEVSRNFNKNIILKENSQTNHNISKRCSLGMIPQSKQKKNPLGLWDYLHHSGLIDKHKAGLISNIGISDMFLDKDQIFLNNGQEFQVKCDRNLRNMVRSDKIFERNERIKEGKSTRLANGIIKNNETSMKPLKRSAKRNNRFYIPKSVDINENVDDGNDSLQSVNENKLDLLYNESINLQKHIKSSEKCSITEKIKRIIKLEELNKTIIEINKRKLHQ